MSRFTVPLVLTILFVLMGLAFIPEAGVQNDEALFASGIYEQTGIAQVVRIGGHRIPFMLINYLGALKSWVYAPIFRFWHPSPASTRVPAILFGAATIWLFWSLLWRLFGAKTALLGAILLTFDPLFLLTTTFDWGPVVFQHLLLVAAVLCLVRFHQEDETRYLAGGFFLLGMGLWDKALFAWVLSGISIAALIVFPKELWKHFSLHHLAVASLAFCLGAGPLIAFNIKYPLETFRANTAFDTGDVTGKARLMRATLNGSALFDYIPRDDPGGQPRAFQTWFEKSSLWVSEKTGGRRLNYFDWILAAAFLLTPWLWFSEDRRPLAWVLVAMLIAFAQMLFTKDAGGSVHHTILLWPLPAFFVALAFRRIPGSVIVAAIVALSSLLVTNEYLAQLVRNGPSLIWTDAIYPLSDCLYRVKPKAIYIDDWGIFDNLRMLNRGKLPLLVGSFPLSKPELDAEEQRAVLERIAQQGSVFVGHPDGQEFYKGVNAKLRAMAQGAGYREEMIAQIPDRNGRAAFEVIRFQPVNEFGKTTPRTE